MDIKPSRSKQLKDTQLRMAREKDSRRWFTWIGKIYWN
jgi:hypothetical protein